MHHSKVPERIKATNSEPESRRSACCESQHYQPAVAEMKLEEGRVGGSQTNPYILPAKQGGEEEQERETRGGHPREEPLPYPDPAGAQVGRRVEPAEACLGQAQATGWGWVLSTQTKHTTELAMTLTEAAGIHSPGAAGNSTTDGNPKCFLGLKLKVIIESNGSVKGKDSNKIVLRLLTKPLFFFFS